MIYLLLYLSISVVFASDELNSSFTRDINNGIVFDFINKLQWQDNTQIEERFARKKTITPLILGDIVSYCAKLSLKGKRWRLPTLIEYKNISNILKKKTIFKYNKEGSYFTSEIKALSLKNYQRYLKSNFSPFVRTTLFNFQYGRIETNYYTVAANVRCVRNIYN